MTDQQHLAHLRSFFQVPQQKRRRRLLLVFIPSLILAGVLGALVGLKDAVWELWDEWKYAWNTLDPDPNWKYKQVKLSHRLPEINLELKSTPVVIKTDSAPKE